MKLFRAAIMSSVLALPLGACGHSAYSAGPGEVLTVSTPATSTRTLSVSPIDVPNAPLEAVSERGTIAVPVSRADADSPMLDIEFFRFKRLPEADPNTPPIFLLRGGPGYAGLGDAVENDAFYRRSVQRYTKISDIVIIGQRGFGTSGDLACDAVPASTWEEVHTSAQSADRYRRTAEQCRDKYLVAGRQLRGYNVKEMAADVIELAEGLGYEKVQIKGNSFGSFWGMAVLRARPDLVARATFSALEGPDHTFDRPSAVKSALDRIAAAAAASDRYSDRIPPEGLLAAYQAVIDRADVSPITVSVEDEERGEHIDVKIDGDALRRFAIGVTTRPIWRERMSEWPDDLLNVIEGDFSDLAPRLYRYLRGTDADSAAEEIIECSSGMSAARRAGINQDPARLLLGTSPLFDERTCALWGDALVDMDRSDFLSPVPTVLIQGTWDVSTPYDEAKTVQNLFESPIFITVEGGSHGAIFEAEETDPSFFEAVNQWYATGDGTDFPERVILPELDWTTPE